MRGARRLIMYATGQAFRGGGAGARASVSQPSGRLTLAGRGWCCQVGGTAMDRFHEDVALAIEKALHPSFTHGSKRCVATKDGKPTGEVAVWSAWDEEANMKLWEKKLRLLYHVEEDLATAAKSRGTAAQLAVLKPTLQKLGAVNRELRMLNGKAAAH
eukprot:COSAG01_NODE_533_length_15816_cov_4.518738_15_plen_158_part_00